MDRQDRAEGLAQHGNDMWGYRTSAFGRPRPESTSPVTPFFALGVEQTMDGLRSYGRLKNLNPRLSFDNPVF
jgi:hypothetical protein